jgi:hypothetical protein
VLVFKGISGGADVHILYVDESGVEQLGAGTEHFVLVGLAIRGDLWKTQDALIEEIKRHYDLQGIEIHTAWMMRRYVEQDRIPGFEDLDRAARRTAAEQEVARRAGVLGVRGDAGKVKSYRIESRKISPYLHLTLEERRRCLGELAEQIGGWASARLFAEAIKKPAFTTQLLTPYEQAFEQVLTRYQSFLQRIEDIGIVVHDQNNTVAPRLMRLTRKFHKTGTLFRKISNIVETPLFVDSELTSMIQMVDLAAYALRRFLDNGEGELWSALRPRVEQVNGVHVGVRHYTGKQPCACSICVDHGRKTGEEC